MTREFAPADGRYRIERASTDPYFHPERRDMAYVVCIPCTNAYGEAMYRTRSHYTALDAVIEFEDRHEPFCTRRR